MMWFQVILTMLTPVAMLAVGLRWRKHPPRREGNGLAYRTALSEQNEDTWRFAHSVFGRIWYRTGLILLPVTLAAMLLVFGRDKDMVGTVGSIVCLVQLPVMLYAILPTERALKKNFDEDGKRK